jgi:hypothetical protein
MKKLAMIFLAAGLLCFTSCTEPHKDDPQPKPHDNTKPQKGYATGKAVDTQGNPLPNASIVVNNSQIYNYNILGTTDANGNYKLALTPGSWYVRGTTTLEFDNKTYILDLQPETEGAFAGTEGAVRNLRMKISGPKTPEFGMSGYYGGSVEIYAYGGEFFDSDGVELTLEPVGALIDGSTGNKIIQNPEGDILYDAPLGKYKISAHYVPENKPLKIRLRNKGQDFGSSVISSFDPAYPGATGSYGLSVQVQPE